MIQIPDYLKKFRSEGSSFSKNDIARTIKISKDYLPIGVAETGELILLQRRDIAENIGMYGARQCGKTLSLWAMTDRLYHNWGSRVFFANELLDTSFDHRYPAISPFFTDRIGCLGQKPQGMPLAYCYPSTESVSVKNHNPHIKLSIPFKEFVTKPHNFVKLDKSLDYFLQIKDRFLNATSYLEIMDALNYLPASIMESSGPKIKAKIDALLNEKVFDVDNPSSTSVVETITEYDEYTEIDPIVGLLKRNYVPVLMTENLMGKRYRRVVFEYYMNQIYKEKMECGCLYEYPVIAMVDELNKLIGKDSDVIIRWVTEGGNLGHGGVGLFWTAQNYSSIHKRIRQNTEVGLCFSQKETEAKEIATDFSLTQTQKKQLKKLSKFEFVALSQGDWVLLDPSTGKISKSREPIKCQILPPLSRHRSHIWKLQAKRLGIEVPKDKPMENTVESGIRIGGKPFLMPYRPEDIMSNQPIIKVGTNLRKAFWGEELSDIITIGIGELERKGFGIMQIQLQSTYAFYSNQRIWYYLYELNQPLHENAIKLLELPNDTKIQLDTKNKRVRLWGANCGAGRIGQWNQL